MKKDNKRKKIFHGEFMLSKCKLCEQTTTLIKAHIIPKFLFVKDNFLVTEDSPFNTRSQIGLYDPAILCKNCDSSIIGQLDDFASKVLIHRKGVTSETLQESSFQHVVNIYRLEDKIGYDIISRFFISILWRASVSTSKYCKAFSLGTYESIAKKVILDSSYNYSAFFSVSVYLLIDLEYPVHFFPGEFTRVDGVNFYVLIIGFFKVIIKCDKRKLPARFKSDFLSTENNFLMSEAKLAELPEYRMLLQTIHQIIENQKC